MDTNYLNAIVFEDESKMAGVECGGVGIKDVRRKALILSDGCRHEEAAKQPEAERIAPPSKAGATVACLFPGTLLLPRARGRSPASY